MTLLLCHLIGDYVLQSHVMATRKTSSMVWALIHATFYTLPFAALVAWHGGLRWGGPLDGLVALVVIAATHALIDRYRVADKWCRFYGVGHPGLWWRPEDVCEVRHEVRASWGKQARVADGPHPCTEPSCIKSLETSFASPPPFLGVWLTIIVDNTMHLCINAACFAALGIS